MKDHLDWIEVRGILRQIAQACADCLDGVFDAKDFVGGKVVHHHNVSALERRRQTLLEVGQKDFAVHCSVDQHRRDYSGETQARNEGHGLPVAQWPSGTYPIKRSPRGLRPFGRTMLVLTAVSSMNTNLAGSRSPCSRIQRRRARATSARCCSAARRLFFNGDVMTSEETPKRRTASTDSFLVHRRNDLIERQVRLLSNKGEDPFRVLLQRGDAPPRGLGPDVLSASQRCIHLIAELALISNCSAASRRDVPASTSPMTRTRISLGYVPRMAHLPANQCA